MRNVGALCPVHTDRPAYGTCRRCGNFMCDECSVGRTQPFCPTCRQLTGVGAGFPFSRDDWDFGRLWSYAWGCFSREWVLLSVGALIYFVVWFLISTVVGQISKAVLAVGHFDSFGWPIAINFIVSTLIQTLGLGIVQMGLYRVYFDVLIGGRADLARMTTQLPKAGKFLLQQILLWVALTLPFLVALMLTYAVVARYVAHVPIGEASAVMREGSGIMLGVGMLLTLPYIFVALGFNLALPELVWSDPDPITALKNSWALAKGNRGWIFLALLIWVMGTVFGAVLCCVPALPAWAMGQMLIASLYLALRRGSGLAEPAAEVR